MQRRDGDEALLNRAKVRILATGPGGGATADPVDLTSPWILHAHEGIGVHSPAQRRHAHAANLIAREGRQVDVQQRVARKAWKRDDVCQQSRQDVDLSGEQSGIGAKVAPRERDRDRWDAEGQTLHGGGDRPRIQDVLAHVLPVIHPAQHEVGATPDERLDGQHHAIGRRPIDLPSSLATQDRPYRMVQRQRMARRALLAIRGDDRDLAQWLGGAHQAVEPVGENPVIVRAQKPHQLGLECASERRCAQIVLTMRAESLMPRKWLTAPYTVGTIALPTRNPACAARMRKSVSNSYRSPRARTRPSTARRMARNPDWVSRNRTPATCAIAALAIALVIRRRSGIDDPARTRSPITTSNPS